MKLASAAYKEVVFGGHLLALGTASMAATVSFVIGRTPTIDLLLMAYLFTYGAYTINRMADFEEDRLSHPERTSYLEGRKGWLLAISVVCFAVGYSLAYFRNLVFFGGLLVPLGLALVYSVSTKQMRGTLGISRLKEGLLVKNLAISFGWSLVPLLVGLYYLDLPRALLALVPFIFLRLMVNTIFFDQRDVGADAAYSVKTIPTQYGDAFAGRVIGFLDLISGVYIVAIAVLGVVPAFAGSLALFVPYSFAYRAYSKSGGHRDSARDLAADGEYILWGVVTYLGHL